MYWIIGDFILIHISMILSLYFRFSLNTFEIPPDDMLAYKQMLWIIGVIPVSVFIMRGNYRVRIRNFYSKDYFDIGVSLFISLIAIVTVSFYIRTLNFSRAVYGIFFVFSFLFCSGMRFWVKIYLKKQWEKGNKLLNLLYISGEDSFDYLKYFNNFKNTGYTIKACIFKDNFHDKLENCSIYNKSDDFLEIINKDNIHGIILAPDLSDSSYYTCICAFLGLHCYMIPQFSHMLSPLTCFSKINEEILIEFKKPEGLEGYDLFKRALDIIISGILIIFCIPLFLIVSFLIKKDSPGKVIFTQKRIGKNGKVFNIYKFRTMSIDISDGPLITQINDPRITKIGSFLRMWSIDELPQLFNIFIGNMSLVGPRPEIPEIVKDYKPWQKVALSIRPGLSGLTQVSGRDNLSIEEKLKIDVYYIQNKSLFMDLWILWKTIFVVISQEGAN